MKRWSKSVLSPQLVNASSTSSTVISFLVVFMMYLILVIFSLAKVVHLVVKSARIADNSDLILGNATT